MLDPIVRSFAPLTLVGGAEVTDEALNMALKLAPMAIAADGGARSLLRAGVEIARVIGDLDSLSARDRAMLDANIVVKVDEQDSTDFEKCLQRIEAPLIIGLGFTGGRLDHQLAAFHAMLKYSERPCVLLGDEEVVFLVPEHMSMDLGAGVPFSLFPLRAVTGTATGLKWSFEELDFEPGVQIGTSNCTTGPVTLRASRAGLLCIVPASAFEAVVKTRLAQLG